MFDPPRLLVGGRVAGGQTDQPDQQPPQEQGHHNHLDQAWHRQPAHGGYVVHGFHVRVTLSSLQLPLLPRTAVKDNSIGEYDDFLLNEHVCLSYLDIVN